MTILLLDLPPEVFTRIVIHLITKAGIVEAWELRKTCRKFPSHYRAVDHLRIADYVAGTFRRSIEFECLANQPTRAFLRPGIASAKNIFRSNMTLYLSYRMTAEKGAYNFLPRLMMKILDTAYQGLPERDHNLRRQHARTLCKLLVEGDPKQVELFLTTKSPEHPQSSSVSSNGSQKTQLIPGSQQQQRQSATCRRCASLWQMIRAVSGTNRTHSAFRLLQLPRATMRTWFTQSSNTSSKPNIVLV